MTKEITGVLENWSYDDIWSIFWGNIYEDIHERFPDGMQIHTSSVPRGLHNFEYIEGDLIKTLNSTYRLGKKHIP